MYGLKKKKGAMELDRSIPILLRWPVGIAIISLGLSLIWFNGIFSPIYGTSILSGVLILLFGLGIWILGVYWENKIIKEKKYKKELEEGIW